MSNETVLVTGASRGLGLKISTYLLEKGCKVYAIARTLTKAAEALKEHHGDRFEFKRLDLSHNDSLITAVLEDFIGHDIALTGFVNNAATAYDDLITNVKLDPLETMFRVNVFSPILLTRTVLRNFLAHRTAGSIVHISSISVHTGYKGLAMYAATKGALEAFSKNTAREWGERKIRSNSVVCGFMETEMTGSLSEKQKNSIYRRNALKEPVSAESAAATVSYLLDSTSSSITGQSIRVDAGSI